MKPTGTGVIYPELPNPLTPSDLHQLFRPSFDERQWAPTIARAPSSQVALLVQLKIFQTLGRFGCAADIPRSAINHVADRMGVECGSILISPTSRFYRVPIFFPFRKSLFGFRYWLRVIMVVR